MQKFRFHYLFALLLTLVGLGAKAQTFAPAGTALSANGNYTWNRMTTINVYSGQESPFVVYQFTVPNGGTGNYTFTMNTVGFPGAINLYQNSFDPTQPIVNFWDNGVLANAAGTVSKTFGGLPANSIFFVVFSGANTGSSGTYSASASGPASLTVAPAPTSVSIRVQPQSQTIASGNSAKLNVYAVGPLPHSWQWYGGVAGNTANPIAGATNAAFSVPPQVVNSTNYWVKITGPGAAGSVNSSAATVTVTGNLNANYNGTFAAGGCTLPNGQLYAVQRFHIQTAGNYAFSITAGFTLATYQNSFDSLHTNVNYWGMVNGFYAVGDYDLLISKNGAGSFSGAIGGGPAIVNLVNAAPPQIMSGPVDTTILSGQTATLRVATTCGTPFTLQWYRGNSGDTANPIATATTSSFTTPALVATTTYWVRMTWATGKSDSGAGTVYVVNGPVNDSGALTACDKTFNRPSAAGTLSGQNCFYQTFVFSPSVDGTYTFTTKANGFQNRSCLYGGIFDPANPLVNLYAVTNTTSPLTAVLQSGSRFVLVITTASAGETGTYTVTNTAGPALVTIYAKPFIVTQPVSTNVFRGQTATLSVVNSSPGVSYQWYQGATCTTRTAINGATGSSYTTGILSDYSGSSYWVELISPGGYQLSSPASIGLMPQAFNDTATVQVNTALNVAVPGVLANDTKANARTLTAVNATQPAHGSVTLAANGSYTYNPSANYVGLDSFTYRATDGTLTSAVATVSITVVGKSQAITFGPLPSKMMGNTPFTVSATASSGLAVSFESSNTNVATVSGSTITLVGGGSATITASQPGGGIYAAAIPVPQTLLVSIDPNTFKPIAYYRLGEEDPGAVAGPSSGTRDSVGTNHLTALGNPSYSADVSASAASHTGSSLSYFLGAGGPSATGALVSTNTDNFGLEAWVKPTTTSGNRCIVFNGNTGNNGWGLYQMGNTYTVLYGGVVSFGSAVVANNTWTHLALVRQNGTATFYVNGVASGSFSGAPNALSGSFAIGTQPQSPGGELFAGLVDEVRIFTFPAGQFSPNELLLNVTNQSITFGSIADRTFGDPAFLLSATAGSGLGVSYTSANTNVATVSGNTITLVGAGSTTLTARQAGNGFFASAKASQTFTVKKAQATVTLGNLSQAYDGSPRKVSVTTSPANLAVNLTYNGLAALPINPGSYTVIGTINETNYSGSTTNTLVIQPQAAPPTLATPTQVDGSFRFTFKSTAGAGFSVLTTTNLALPLSSWTVLDSITEGPAGQFQFVDQIATNTSQRFFRVKGK